MRAKWLVVIYLGVIISTAWAVENTYMGQDPPGLTPKIFAPGLISQDSQYEVSITFSPDGNECFFTQRAPDWSNCWIMQTIYSNNTWTKPERAPFTNDRSLSASISPDGKRLLFSSNRDTEGKQGIWQCTRTEDQTWSEPVEMDRQISSITAEWSCHVSDLGNVFVCSWRPGGQGNCDGWRIPCVDGQYQPAENLTVLNTGVNDCGVAPGPRERYLVFMSKRPGGQGDNDLYLSYAKPEGGWTEPRNLGPTINSPKSDGGPWISHDGRYLFFTSNRAGLDDIYWVETRAFLSDPNGPIENKTSG
jgi:Tol biopolymer transport system component